MIHFIRYDHMGNRVVLSTHDPQPPTSAPDLNPRLNLLILGILVITLSILGVLLWRSQEGRQERLRDGSSVSLSDRGHD